MSESPKTAKVPTLWSLGRMGRREHLRLLRLVERDRESISGGRMALNKVGRQQPEGRIEQQGRMVGSGQGQGIVLRFKRLEDEVMLVALSQGYSSSEGF